MAVRTNILLKLSNFVDGVITGAKLADTTVTNSKLATGIDATKLADGTITNTELQYINSVTSNVQTQINAKQNTLVANDITTTLINNNAVTKAKFEQIGAYKTLANITGSTANLTEVNIGYIPNGAVALSGNVTYAKADFAGRTHLLLSTNDTTTRTFTLGTGFVAGDFICLLIDQNSSGAITLQIGSATILTNKGIVINALFNGTNWNVWTGSGVFNTINANFSNTAVGLQARTTGTGNTAVGFNVNASGSTDSTSIGNGATASAQSSTGVGALSNITGTSATGIGNGIVINALLSTGLGRGANSNSNSYVTLLNSFAYSRRIGAIRWRLDTNTSTTDATNPSYHGEKIGWNGTTTNNTITEIFLRGVASNRCVLQAKNVIAFRGQAVAFKSDYTGSARWDITGLIKRDGANVTTLVGHTKTKSHSDGTGNTVDLTISADDTNESLRLQVTGNASETWTWLVELELLDLRIA